MLPELPEARMVTRKPIEVSPSVLLPITAKNICPVGRQRKGKQIFTMMAERGRSVNGEG
jgi:hypothetical protein